MSLDDMGNGLSIGRIYELKAPITPKEAAERGKRGTWLYLRKIYKTDAS